MPRRIAMHAPASTVEMGSSDWWQQVERHRSEIESAVRSRVPHVGFEFDDVWQNTLLRLLEKVRSKTLTDPEDVGGYLCVVATGFARDARKKRSREERLLAEVGENLK